MATDPFDRLLTGLDRPLAPRAEFAEELLDRLLADLGPGQPKRGGGGGEPTPLVPLSGEASWRAATERRGWWPYAEAAAAIVLMLTLLTGIVGRNAIVGFLTGREESAPGANGDSPLFRVDPGRTGVVPGDGFGRPVSIRWRRPLDGIGIPAMAATGGVVYLGDCLDGLVALDAATGDERWRSEARGAPAVVQGIVYVGTVSGDLLALAADDGREIWRTAIADNVCGAPLVDAGVVYLGSGDGHFAAVDAETGEIRWRRELGECCVGAIASTDGDAVYFGAADGLVFALDAATGDERWRFQTEGQGVMGTTVRDETVYAATAGGALYALDAASGAARWRFVAFQTVYLPIVTREMVYTGGDDGNLYALDARTGEERWAFATGGAVTATPHLVGETIVLGNLAGLVWGIDATTGEPRFQVNLGEAPGNPMEQIADGSGKYSPSRGAVGSVSEGPIVAGDQLYVVTDGGQFAVALGESPPGGGAVPSSSPAP